MPFVQRALQLHELSELTLFRFRIAREHHLPVDPEDVRHRTGVLGAVDESLEAFAVDVPARIGQLHHDSGAGLGAPLPYAVLRAGMAHCKPVESAAHKIGRRDLPPFRIQRQPFRLEPLERNVERKRPVVPAVEIVVALKPVLHLRTDKKPRSVGVRPVGSRLLAHCCEKCLGIRRE